MVLNTQLSDTRQPLQRTWQAPKAHHGGKWYTSVQCRRDGDVSDCIFKSLLGVMTAAKNNKAMSDKPNCLAPNATMIMRMV